MSYKSLQEGMAVGNAFMQAGLSIGKTKKDLEDRELDAEDREIEDLSAMHASELSKNYKARQADPSIAEYHPKPTNAKEAKAYHKGGLLFVKSMTDELNLDTARQKNQSEKYRSEMEELAKKTRNWYTITNEKEAYQAYREIHNKSVTGNNITSITDDGIATVQPADNNREPYTIQLTRESMTKALTEMLSDPKEVMTKRAAAILHARNHNLEAQENAQLYTRENKDGTTSTIWQVKGQLKPGTDELEPTYFTSDYPPYDNVKLDKNVIGDLATWKKADAVMTEKEKAAETLATKTAEEGLEGAKALTRARKAQASVDEAKAAGGGTDKTPYGQDKAKLMDDTNAHYRLLMTALQDEDGDIKQGPKDDPDKYYREYDALSEKMKADKVSIGKGEDPSWLRGEEKEITVVRTGKDKSGRKVEELSDGTIRYAD